MNLQGFPPRCYLIGAQKAGTTYLANLLDQHPEIVVSKPKETDFYTGRIFPKGFDWYRDCFPGDADKVLIDASTSYSAAYPLSDPRSQDLSHSFCGVAQRIVNEAPDAKFLYIIRNPIKRTYSAYYHFVRTGEENRSFHDMITTDDEKREYYYLLSDYEIQLEHYLQLVDSQRIKILLFEEFIQSPEHYLQDCFTFLGLPEWHTLDFGSGKHGSYQYSGLLQKTNQLLAPVGGLRPILGKVKKILPEALVQKGISMGTESIPPMDNEDKNILTEYFAPKVEKLEKLISKPLSTLWFAD